MKLWILWIFILGLLVSCQNDSKNPQMQETGFPLTNQEFFSSLNDSVYFDVISCMSSFEKGFVIADMKNVRVTFLDKNLNFLNHIGREGKGPGEFLTPGIITVNEEDLYVQDLTGKKIDVFKTSGNYVKSFTIPSSSSLPTLTRFAVGNKANIYLSTPFDEHCITKVDQNGNKLLSFGTSTKDSRMASNVFNIPNKEQILVSFSTLPIIEKYSYEGELIERYEFGHIASVKNSLSFIEQLYKDQHLHWNTSFYALFQDGYCIENYLYILMREHPEDAEHPGLMMGSKILVFDISEQIRFEKILDLNPQKEKYSSISFCVKHEESHSFLLTYELGSGSLQKFTF